MIFTSSFCIELFVYFIYLFFLFFAHFLKDLRLLPDIIVEKY
jgi:hypothetical protein